MKYGLASTMKQRCYHHGKHVHLVADCSKGQAQDLASNVDLLQGKCVKYKHVGLAYMAEEETSFAF